MGRFRRSHSSNRRRQGAHCRWGLLHEFCRRTLRQGHRHPTPGPISHLQVTRRTSYIAHFAHLHPFSPLSYFASHLYGPNDSCVVGRYTAPSSVFQMYSTDEVEVLTDISRRRPDANHTILVSTGHKLVRSSIPGVHRAAATSLEPGRQAC